MYAKRPIKKVPRKNRVLPPLLSSRSQWSVASQNIPYPSYNKERRRKLGGHSPETTYTNIHARLYLLSDLKSSSFKYGPEEEKNSVANLGCKYK